MSRDLTTYHREYARRKRHAQWLAAAALAEHCPATLARGVPCGWPLESRFVAGQTVPFCAQCDRKARGICLDCQTEPVYGRPRSALRCAACKKLALAAAEDRWRAQHPETVKAAWARRKARLLADPETYAAVTARKRLWRKANPTRVKKHKQKNHTSDRAREYYAAYRAAHRAEIAARQRERERLVRRGERPTHPCVDCQTPISGRAKKCDPCKRAAFVRARAILTGRAA